MLYIICWGYLFVVRHYKVVDINTDKYTHTDTYIALGKNTRQCSDMSYTHMTFGSIIYYVILTLEVNGGLIKVTY